MIPFVMCLADTLIKVDTLNLVYLHIVKVILTKWPESVCVCSPEPSMCWCRQVPSILRNLATFVGLFHRSITFRGVGFLMQLNRCFTSWGDWLHFGQLLGVSGLILLLYSLVSLLKPDLSWARVDLAPLLRDISDLSISGGFLPRTLFGLYLDLAWETALVCNLLFPDFNDFLSVTGRQVVNSFLELITVVFIFLGGGGRSRCFWPGWPGRWVDSRNCFERRLEWCLSGRTLVSWCKWSSLVME